MANIVDPEKPWQVVGDKLSFSDLIKDSNSVGKGIGRFIGAEGGLMSQFCNYAVLGCND